MRIFGEELGKAGRWYVALPPVLLIGFLIGLFFMAAAGHRRLNAANERVHASETRQTALGQFFALITEAESEQRGYLLTGEPAHLQTYAAAAAKVGPALDRLDRAYVDLPERAADIGRLRSICGKKFAQLEWILFLYRQQGMARAVSAMRTDVDRQTIAQIAEVVEQMREKESADLSAAASQWRSDLWVSRWVTAGGAVLDVGLVVLATALVWADMRRRALQALDLGAQKQDLARQVEERTGDLTALSTHLQGVSEQEKSALSRELHDELGGLLVAARMDLSWLQLRLPTSDPAIEQRFRRIHESLSAGVDLKRRVVEELRPTLLDNMGLFTALRWQFKESCRRNGLECTETIPDIELRFDPHAAIGVFRVAQEALTNILKHADARAADLTVMIQDQTFVLRISDDGRGVPAGNRKNSTSHGLSSMKHRMAALGGRWHLESPATGGTIVIAQVPMARMLQDHDAGMTAPAA